MATLLQGKLVQKSMADNSRCEIYSLLAKHGWRPEMTLQEVEIALIGLPAYTYAIHPREGERGFTFSFVNKFGFIEHHPLTLLSPKHNIWRNTGPAHIGKLDKVISDMLGNSEGQPL